LVYQEQNIIFGGGLGEYKYYDMDKTIEVALKKSEELLRVSV
jgi:UDP-galactopyranose mutase